MAVYNLWINYPTLCWWLLNFSYTCSWKIFTESRSLLFCKRVSWKYKGLHDQNLKSNGTKFVEKTLHHYPGIHIRMFCVQSILGLGTASLNLAPRINTIYISVNSHHFPLNKISLPLRLLSMIVIIFTNYWYYIWLWNTKLNKLLSVFVSGQSTIHIDFISNYLIIFFKTIFNNWLMPTHNHHLYPNRNKYSHRLHQHLIVPNKNHIYHIISHLNP